MKKPLERRTLPTSFITGSTSGDQSFENQDGIVYQRHIRGIAPADNGGFVFTGYNHIYAIDSQGEILWEKTYGDGVGIAESIDGGYVIANKIVLKIDPEGNILWNKTLLDIEGSRIAAITQSSEGGHVLVGQVSCGIFITMIDDNGNQVWEKVYGGEHGDTAYSVVESDDGGFVIAGSTCSYGPEPGGETMGYLIKVDASGEFVWHMTYGGYGTWAEKIIPLEDGYIAVGGKAFTNEKDSWWEKWYIVKINPET